MLLNLNAKKKNKYILDKQKGQILTSIDICFKEHMSYYLNYAPTEKANFAQRIVINIDTISINNFRLIKKYHLYLKEIS